MNTLPVTPEQVQNYFLEASRNQPKKILHDVFNKSKKLMKKFQLPNIAAKIINNPDGTLC